MTSFLRGPLAIVFVLAAISGCQKDEKAEAIPPVTVHCVGPTREAIDAKISLRGHLEPPPGGDLPVASQVAGRVVQISVHEGQRIASGDLVANVDDASSRDAVHQAEATVAQARANEVNATTTLERTRALVARGIAAGQELDDAVARAAAARASTSSANAAIDLARRTLGRVQVRSGVAGVVTHVWRGPGALVDGTAATPIVQLAASDAVEFVADATERDLSSIQEGQDARGALLSSGDVIEGKVRARSSALDPMTGLGTVRVTLSSARGSVPIGAFGRIEIVTTHRDGVLVLPSAALRGAVADGAEVAVCKGKKAEIRSVKVGWRDETKIEVLAGLSTEDRVAVDHVLGLDNDTAIEEAK